MSPNMDEQFAEKLVKRPGHKREKIKVRESMIPWQYKEVQKMNEWAEKKRSGSLFFGSYSNEAGNRLDKIFGKK